MFRATMFFTRVLRYFVCIAILLFTPFLSSAGDGEDEYLFNELSRLAQDGNSDAQYHLGMFYNNGIGTTKDMAKALSWFEKSAASGHPLGNYKLGCYYSGQGMGVVETDYLKALKFKLIAAEAGYALAQHDVAAIYYRNKEMDKVVLWLQKAADQGLPDAVYALFSFYQQGTDVPKDMTKAYGYLKIIERNIGPEQRSKVEAKLKLLESELSQTQRDEVKKYVENWNATQTDLTMRARNGKEETRRIIKSAKEQ